MLLLPKLEKPPSDWCATYSHILDPLRHHRNALLAKWMRQRKKKSDVPNLERAKRRAVKELNKACNDCFNVCVQGMVGEADRGFDAQWTKDGWTTVKEVPSFGEPKQVFESPLRTSPGVFTKADAECLKVVGAYLGKLLQKPTLFHMEVLDALAQRPQIVNLDRCPTTTEVRAALRKLRYSAGGVDGLRPEHLKALAQDNDLFQDCVAKCVEEFWEDLRVPATWETCDTVLLFKKGDASQPENFRTIVKLVVQEKLVLTIIGERLHKVVVDSLGAEHETQRGFRGLCGCIDAVFNLRVHLKKRQEH